MSWEYDISWGGVVELVKDVLKDKYGRRIAWPIRRLKRHLGLVRAPDPAHNLGFAPLDLAEFLPKFASPVRTPIRDHMMRNREEKTVE